ncbi:MAG: hypothetical protein Q8Q28_03345 [Pseudomonadota bacterium]|nr:hypothetical protein [Pseudomonadota bacterium]
MRTLITPFFLALTLTACSSEASIQYPAAGLILEALFAPGELARQGRAFRLAGLRDGRPPELDTTGARARAPIAAALAPFRGWEADPFDDTTRGRARVDAYLRTLEASAAYSNTLMTELAGKMSVAVQKDPDAAKREIRRLWAAFDPKMLSALWFQSVADASGGAILDLSTGQGVGWSSGNGSFLGDAAGLVWQKNGQTWLGDGSLTGRKYQVSLASAIATEMRATSSAATLEETGSRSETGGTASAGK